jgi:molybdate transport system regulatory protein
VISAFTSRSYGPEAFDPNRCDLDGQHVGVGTMSQLRFCAMMRAMTAAPKVAPAPGSNVPARLAETTVKTKVWLERDGAFVIGDGGLRLLLGIIEHGSLLRAVREIRWSYRHAWGYLRRAEAALGTPLTEPRPGKGRSRGTALTEAGLLVIEQLARGRNRIDDAVGPSGPTASDVAARGRAPAARAPHPRVSRYRDGDWRRRR